jgi:hypothetical protein
LRDVRVLNLYRQEPTPLWPIEDLKATHKAFWKLCSLQRLYSKQELLEG